MTRTEYNQRRKAFERAVTAAKKKVALAELLSDKIRASVAVRDANETLRQHKLHYYELVIEED